jgi:hypothetical protein
MPEDFEPRFAIEPEPKLVDKYTVRQDSYLWVNGGWDIIGKRYSQMASHKVSEDVLKWLEKNSTDKKEIDKIKAEERAKRMNKNEKRKS